ncbi:MAG: SxtJ family membrane protein [Gammaproteobacteria bacterium]
MFGWVLGTMFLIIAVYPALQGASVRLWALAVGGLLVAFAWRMPRALAPLNRVWTRLGIFLGHIFAPVALGVVFFCVIAPIGICMRVARHDSLRLRRSPQIRSYWQPRDPPGPDAQSLPQQF